MLILNEQQVLNAVSCNEVMDAVEEALRIYQGGDYQMPLRMAVPLGSGNMLLLMPCLAGKQFSTKMITLFPGNTKQNLPMINGLVVYNCPDTGRVLAIMDGKSVTALRTAAVTGVSVRHLAHPDAASVGLIGCGVQGFFQVLFSITAATINRVILYDAFSDDLNPFIQRLTEKQPGIDITVADSPETLVRQSDIVITATTATEPVIEDDPSLFANKHVVAIGSYQPHIRELPDAVFSMVKTVYVDTEMALEESGELLIPQEKGLFRKEQLVELGDLMVNRRPVDRGTHGTTLMKSVGMALFDLMTAQLVYDKAKTSGIGTEADL